MDLLSLRKLLAQVGYLQVHSNIESLLYSGEERFQLLQWLFERFFGESDYVNTETPLQSKNPSPGDVSKDEIKINHLANLAVMCGVTENYEIELIRGTGSVSERIKFLYNLLDLLKSSQEYDKILKKKEDAHIRLLDSAIKEVSNLNSKFALFPADIQFEQINSPSFEDEMKNLLFDFKSKFFEYQSQLEGIEIKKPISSDKDLISYKEKISNTMNEFYNVASKFDKVYSVDSHHLDFNYDRPELIGIGPLSTSILKFDNLLQKLLNNLRRLKRCQEIGSTLDEHQVLEISKEGDHLLQELEASLKSMNVF